MNISKQIITSVILLIFISCSYNNTIITGAKSSKIAIDNSFEKIADKNYTEYLQVYKQKIDTLMNVVIGKAAETMRAHKPESLLSNFCADVYLKTGSNFLKYPVDIAIVNLGGLRTQIPEGDIKVRNVFELMPFENELVILWLKGDKLNDLLQYFAAAGGEGVAGLRMEIKNGKAINIKIGGNALDINKKYTIATNDYLAGGNDKMVQLARYEKIEFTNIKIRDMLLEHIKAETLKGNKIQTKLDGRIK
ncbi:MAG: 5'-nucleotidase [Paludibacter sp.]|nr:5'-nucleotidase [Paludibacter sp.]